MNIAEARSYNDGIEFYIHDKNISIRITRDSKGDIIVTKNTINQFKKAKKSKLMTLFIIAISIVYSFIINYCNNYKIEIIAILTFVWIVTFIKYFIDSKNPRKLMLFKYHAAEHKVLNYMDKYGNATQNFNEIMKMSYISIRCGSTIIGVFYVLTTLIVLGIIFIPGIILKSLWCLISIFITLYLWANGKCDFFQKLVLREPGYAEVELATRGLLEYMKMKE